LKLAAREQKSVKKSVVHEQKTVKKQTVHGQEFAYPPAYPGFDQEDIDEALDDLTRQVTRQMGMPTIVSKIVNVAHRAARGRA
jgi:hypothetical protein